MTDTLTIDRALAPAIPRSPEGLTTTWVEQALAAGGRLGCRVERVEMQRIGEGVGILAELYRLTLTHGAGGAPGPASVIAKIHSNRPEVREICAAYGFYEREARFYQEVAPTLDLTTPAHYFSAFDAVTGDCVIVMEDVAPAQSPDQVAGIPLDMLTEALDSVAALHARWWNNPALADLAAVMPPANRPPYSNVPDNYRAYLPAALAGLTARGEHDLARVATKFGAGGIDKVMLVMAAEPRTLAHGDFRVDNLMFRRTDAGPKLTVVDWQIVMQARGAYDVGYLMGGAVETGMRRAEEMRLLRRYHDALLRRGVAGYSFEECFNDYRYAVLVGLNYWVQGYPVSDQGNPRAVALFDSWAQRLDAAVKDLGLEALLD